MAICSYVLFWLFNLSSTETPIEISVKMQWHCTDSPEGGKKILSMLLTSLGNFLLCSELIFFMLCLHC